MLLLLFHLGSELYAIESSQVIEIIPTVNLRPLYHVPDYVAGLFNYRGKFIPVIDLSQLLQATPCHLCLSTRIVIVNYINGDKPLQYLGLMAEKITDTLKKSDVSTGVMEMDKFNKEVTSTVGDVGNISRQIAQVIEQVQSVTPQFEWVSKRMEEQSRSARHIREAMEQLSEGSENTAYSLRDTNHVLEKLDDAAQVLQSEISVFKVQH
jgi:chemotaxis signal transduction protein